VPPDVFFRYAVTGAEDNKLRLWPLDFTDFLLEAQHEGVVSNIRIALDGRKLAIGTTVGTVGVLNVSEHSYNTVLRSHSAAVTQAVPCTFGPHRGKIYFFVLSSSAAAACGKGCSAGERASFIDSRSCRIRNEVAVTCVIPLLTLHHLF
jgi:WD40 repeat protein